MKLTQSIFFGIILLFISGQLSAQVSFEAYADAREILQGGEFRLVYSIKNTEAESFTAPSFSGFQQIGPPSRGFNTTIVNGKVSKESTITYRLKALNTGTFSISAAAMQAQGKTYRSNPVSIKVVPARAGGGDRTDQVFLQAEIDKTEAYVGEQLVLDYVLYTRVEVDKIYPTNEPKYQGFFARETDRFDNRQVKVVLNGIQYITKTIKRVVLYPQKSGTLIGDSYALNLAVVTGENNRPRSFFYRPKTTRVAISSESFTVDVKPLPEPRPDNFSGITGNFSLLTQITKNNITTDDALSVVVTLKGEGDLKRIIPPELTFAPEFEVYDPNLLTEEYTDYFDRVVGEKKYEYLLVPQKSGTFQLKTEIVIFNPDSAKYVTLASRPFPIRVGQGTGKTTTPDYQNEDLSGISPPVEKIGSNTSLADSLLTNGLGFGLLALPVFLIAGLFVYRKKQVQKNDIDPVLRKQQLAREEALKRLVTAEAFRENGNSKGFYDEVEKTLLGYIGDKLQISRSEMTKTNVESQLNELHVEEGKVTQFMDLLKTCEMALYAGKDNAEAMESTYNQTLSLISEIEVFLK